MRGSRVQAVSALPTNLLDVPAPRDFLTDVLVPADQDFLSTLG